MALLVVGACRQISEQLWARDHSIGGKHELHKHTLARALRFAVPMRSCNKRPDIRKSGQHIRVVQLRGPSCDPSFPLWWPKLYGVTPGAAANPPAPPRTHGPGS